jgi:hypothetical protein
LPLADTGPDSMEGIIEATELEEALNEKGDSADEHGCAGTQTFGGDEDDIEDKEEDEVPNTQC